jgi:ribonucleoside-diphosphate reductase alpha chain
MIQKMPLEIKKSDMIITDNGEHTWLLSSNRNDINDTKYVDITVEDTNTFFAQSNLHEKMVLTHNSQGGIRGGSATLNCVLWHKEIMDILVLKNNKGTEDNRLRHMDYCIQFNKVMFERLLTGGNITLFSPHDVPGMYEAYFNDVDKFRTLYEKAEKNPNISKTVMSAVELFSAFMTERMETGRIYFMNVDHCNDHGSFLKELASIRMTNLCTEITLTSKPLNDINDPDGEIAICTLAAINIGKIKKVSDFEKPMKITVRFLNALLDYQSYPVIAAHNATMKRRPLGIGLINLAHWLAKNDTDYTNTNLELLHEYTEAWTYYGIKASADMAKEHGCCPRSDETKYHQGILPIDTYKKDVDTLVEPVYNMPWNELREQLKEFGILNSTLFAIAPTENSAILSNATNSVNAPRAAVSVKETKEGTVRQVVPQIQKLKNKYEYLWDHKSPLGMLNISAVLQKFIDQSISTDTSYNPAHYPEGKIPMSEMIGHLLHAYKYGIKTGYYCNVKDDAGEIDINLEQGKLDDEECDACNV